MEDIRYLNDVTTIKLDRQKCTGCRMCEAVCPHGVFKISEKKALLADRDGCMECGACALNCSAEAITVTPGVGCAAFIIQSWFVGKEAACCGPGSGCC